QVPSPDRFTSRSESTSTGRDSAWVRLISSKPYRSSSAPAARPATAAVHRSAITALRALLRTRSWEFSGGRSGTASGQRQPTRGKPQRGTAGYLGGPEYGRRRGRGRTGRAPPGGVATHSVLEGPGRRVTARRACRRGLPTPADGPRPPTRSCRAPRSDR